MLRELGYCSDMTATPRPAEFSFIGRIPVTEVFPVIEDGRWPTKAVVGETIPIRATVFREATMLLPPPPFWCALTVLTARAPTCTKSPWALTATRLA